MIAAMPARNDSCDLRRRVLVGSGVVACAIPALALGDSPRRLVAYVDIDTKRA